MSKFVVKKKLTLPLFKFESGVVRYFRFDSAIFVGKELKGKKEGNDGKDMAPAHLARVIDLDTGEKGEIIVNAVLESTLNESEGYENGGYVGKCFAIEKKAREKGKRYDKFSIDEIEDPSAPAAATEVAAPVAKGASTKR